MQASHQPSTAFFILSRRLQDKAKSEQACKIWNLEFPDRPAHGYANVLVKTAPLFAHSEYALCITILSGYEHRIEAGGNSGTDRAGRAAGRARSPARSR